MKNLEELADEAGEKIYNDIVGLIGKHYVVVSIDDGEERDVVQLEEILPELLYRAIQPKLTEAHQAGIDEAVEVVSKLKQNRPRVPEDDQEERWMSEHIGYNQALDDIIKALQDNK